MSLSLLTEKGLKFYGTANAKHSPHQFENQARDALNPQKNVSMQQLWEHNLCK